LTYTQEIRNNSLEAVKTIIKKHNLSANEVKTLLGAHKYGIGRFDVKEC